VLILDDPDAPDPQAPKRRTWVHWVLFNIPPTTTTLHEGISASASSTSSSALLPPGTVQGFNDWNQVGYGGPSPPIGTHRYFFKLDALDVDTLVLPLSSSTSTSMIKATVVQAMQNHILGQAELIGTYHMKQK
jgi:Raf kinase inhibitor-like YbhB/YbcL family protein